MKIFGGGPFFGMQFGLEELMRVGPHDGINALMRRNPRGGLSLLFSPSLPHEDTVRRPDISQEGGPHPEPNGLTP